jgi:hypothetical protein
MSLFAVFLLLRGNLQDLALPDFLGIEEINAVLVEVLEAFLFVPFKQRIRILPVYYTYNLVIWSAIKRGQGNSG